MKDIRSLEYHQLENELQLHSQPRYRTLQIYDWIHNKRISDINQMTNIPKNIRTLLHKEYYLDNLIDRQILVSKKDQTSKYLFELRDGNLIESVLMHYKHGNSICISSQVGCKMGCRFCASTLGGVVRNLTTGEMLEQVYAICRITNETINNIVVMGMGEPLDNYENLIGFIKIIADSRGMNLSSRNITISTCGIPDKIRMLADSNIPVTLALSLHSANHDKRRELMPGASVYGLQEAISACKYYYDVTHRRITFEYALMRGINDSKEDGRELIKLIRDINCHVNLIPINPITEREYEPSSIDAVDRFRKLLENNRINVTIRREMGRDINGACGQLRHSFTT